MERSQGTVTVGGAAIMPYAQCKLNGNWYTYTRLQGTSIAQSATQVIMPAFGRSGGAVHIVPSSSTLSPCPFTYAAASSIIRFNTTTFAYNVAGISPVAGLYMQPADTVFDADSLPQPTSLSGFEIVLLSGIYPAGTGIISFLYLQDASLDTPDTIFATVSTAMLDFSGTAMHDPRAYIVVTGTAAVMDDVYVGPTTSIPASAMHTCYIGTTSYQYIRPSQYSVQASDGFDITIRTGTSSAGITVAFVLPSGEWPVCPFPSIATAPSIAFYTGLGTAVFTRFSAVASKKTSERTAATSIGPIVNLVFAANNVSLVLTRPNVLSQDVVPTNSTVSTSMYLFQGIPRAATLPGSYLTIDINAIISRLVIGKITYPSFKLPQCVMQSAATQLYYVLAPPSTMLAGGVEIDFVGAALGANITVGIVGSTSNWSSCPFNDGNAIAIAFNTSSFDYAVTYKHTTIASGHYAGASGSPALTPASQIAFSFLAGSSYMSIQYTDDDINRVPTIVYFSPGMPAYTANNTYVATVVDWAVSLDIFGRGAGLSPPSSRACIDRHTGLPLQYTRMGRNASIQTEGFYASFSLGTAPSVVELHLIPYNETITTTTTTTTLTTPTTTTTLTTPITSSGAHSTSTARTTATTATTTTTAAPPSTMAEGTDFPPETAAVITEAPHTTSAANISSTGPLAPAWQPSWAMLGVAGGVILVVGFLVVGCTSARDTSI